MRASPRLSEFVPEDPESSNLADKIIVSKVLDSNQGAMSLELKSFGVANENAPSKQALFFAKSIRYRSEPKIATGLASLVLISN